MTYDEMMKVGGIKPKDLALMKQGVKYYEIGFPVKDVMDECEVQEAMVSLVKILNAAKKRSAQ